jgi:predicted CXXCH cytochrome family protein
VRLVALSVVIAACSHPPPPPPAAPIVPGPVASNMLRTDYAGSATCADCHENIYASWEASPMRNMTRDAATATIRAPFDGATLTVGTDTCTMETEGGARFMRVVDKRGTTRFKITKVVGGRYREDFVGIDTSGALPHERVLPATYVFSTKSWRYKGYSVMVKERPAMSTNAVWSQDCIACHNTLPLATMLYDELYGPGLPSYQGKLSDHVLPRSRLWTAVTRDDSALAKTLEDEIAFLGGKVPSLSSAHELLPVAAKTSEAQLDGSHLVELGIGCEACHNGSKDHANEPKLKPAFDARGSVVGVVPPHGQTGTTAQWINHTCAKCHTVLFSRYPWTWEGGDRTKNPGGSSISSGEGRDYQLGGCASQMACTTCHDPHSEDRADKLAKLATPDGNATCITCHTKFAAAGAVENHSHHKTGSVGTSCIACHMPKKNMGLDYGLLRYHRIGSATDPRRVLGDRPLECALCHADASVDKLVTTMETWYRKSYDRQALRALYGDDLSVNALYATIARGKPHEQATAIAVLGEAKDRHALAPIAGQLAHDYPLVRYFAVRALESITGKPVSIDVGQPAAAVRIAADRWLTAAAASP